MELTSFWRYQLLGRGARTVWRSHDTVTDRGEIDGRLVASMHAAPKEVPQVQLGHSPTSYRHVPIEAFLVPSQESSPLDESLRHGHGGAPHGRLSSLRRPARRHCKVLRKSEPMGPCELTRVPRW